MVQAIGSFLGALGSQEKREISRPMVVSPVPYIAGTDKKTAKQIRDAAREERIYNLLMQPEILGMVLTFAGVLAANNIPFSDDEAQNDLLQGIMTTVAVTMGLGYANVPDLTALSVAIAAGGASVLGSFIEGGTDSLADKLNPFQWKWPLGPIWNWNK